MVKAVNMFPLLYNIQDFKVGDHPEYHPDSTSFTKYWEEQEQMCLVGAWGNDSDGENGGWRYMPGFLYYYINFCIIDDEDEKGNTTRKIKPLLRDVEWMLSYGWITCRGFSGFTEDEEHTSHSLVKSIEDNGLKSLSNKEKRILNKIKDSVLKPDGTYKKYVEAREYLYSTHNKPLGEPLYLNQAQNLFVLGSRGFGKSFFCGNAIIGHEYNFFGKKFFDSSYLDNPAPVEIFVGSALASKSAELLKKFSSTQEWLKKHHGSWGKGDDFIPGYFYGNSTGTLAPNNASSPYRHEYKYQEGNTWLTGGTGTKIMHGVYTSENPQAAVGTRPTVMVIEEVGLLGNLLETHACFARDTMVRMWDTTLKPIQDIQVGDFIMGHDGTMRTVKKTHFGVDQMYKISQRGGVNYTVNSKHKLVLEQKRGTKTDGRIVPTAKDWYESDISKSRRSRTYGIKSGLLEFDKQDLLLDPYYMGLYMGDGVVKSGGIVVHDIEANQPLTDWVKDYFCSLGITYHLDFRSDCPLIRPSRGTKKIRKINPVIHSLRNYGILNKKEIPVVYLLSDEKDRLKLLAGFIDTDGTYSHREGGSNYVISISGRPKLADQLQFLASSLGFKVSQCEHYSDDPNIQERYITTISGDIWKIPTKLHRKQAKETYHQSTIHCGVKIEKIGLGTYYGFELDENPLFLLEDNTILHNSNETCQIRRTKFGSSIYIGCVCEGTGVWTRKGEFKRIENLKESDGILSKSLSQDISLKNGRPRTLCYEILTNSGRRLNCSYDHPVLTRKRTTYLKHTSEYIETQYLTTGDHIAVVDKVDIWSDKRMFNPRLIGLLISDGSYPLTYSNYTKKNGNKVKHRQVGHVMLHSADDEVWNMVESEYETKELMSSTTTKDGRTFKKQRILGISPEIEKLGLRGQSSVEKRLPVDIQSYCKEDVCELIGGLFDGDGCIYIGKNNYCTIKYTTISSRLMYDLFYTLQKLGIHGKIRIENPRKTSIANGKHCTYNLYIKDKISLERFCDNINLLVKRKQEKLDLIKNIMRSRKSKYKKYDNLRYEKIVSVRDIGEQEVFNLTALGDHCYLAAGIETHNTGGNMEKITESKIVFQDPEAYNFLPYKDLWENRSKPIGFFLPSYYVDNDFKDENGNTDVEAAFEQEMIERKKREKAATSSALDGYMMSRPIVPSEMFLSPTANIFPTAKLREREAHVLTNDLFEIHASIGKLVWNTDKTEVTWIEDTARKLKPIKTLNLDSYRGDINGAIIIYEHPPDHIPNPTYRKSLYKVVYDPVKDDGGGTSLASILVYKGFADGSWNMGAQNGIVAEYIGRYDQVNDIHDIAIKIATYFNAKVMVENNIPDFIRYCKMNKLYHRLQISPYEAISKALANPSRKYEMGIHMSKQLNIHCEQLIRQYLLEPWRTLEDGRVLTNIDKIYSLRLLQEFIAYDRDGNFDHISSMKLLALWLSQERQVPIEEKIDARPMKDLDGYLKRRRSYLSRSKQPFHAY